MTESGPNGPSWTTLLGLGITAAGALAIGILAGWGLDAALGTSPVFTLVGIAVGLIGAAVYIVAQFRKYLKTPNS